MSIDIKSKPDAMRAVFNAVRFRMQYPSWVTIQAAKVSNEIIVDEVHKRMRDFEYSQKIIDETFLSDFRLSDGQIEFDVISNYKAESGFDVALAREKGTSRHFIAPIFKVALSWIMLGIRRFSKGHWVRGITASNVIEKTVDEMMPIAQARLDEDTDTIFNRTMGA